VLSADLITRHGDTAPTEHGLVTNLYEHSQHRCFRKSGRPNPCLYPPGEWMTGQARLPLTPQVVDKVRAGGHR
jgi:hypothetical protein